MPHCVKAEGWAALPRDLLGPLVRQAAEAVQAGGPLSLAEAESLLCALGPCRHWRAVVLEEAAFRLRLDSYEQLVHPLLLRLACRELILPEQPLPEPPTYLRSAANAQACLDAGAAAATAEAVAAVQLLASPAFQARSAACLESLVNLPARAAAQAPALLHAFPRLQRLGLQAAHEWALDIGRALPPGCLPHRLQRLEARLGTLEGLHWVPAGLPLAEARITARTVRLWDAQPPLSCAALRLTGAHRLTVSVEALWSLDSVQQLELVAPGGDLTLRPLPADEPAVWAQQPGPVYDYGLPAQALVTKWLRCCAPLFAPGRALRGLSLVAQRLFLLVHNADQDVHGYVDPGLELQLLSPLPPSPDGVWAAPTPVGGPPLAVDAADGGLAGFLRSHVPGAPAGACVLAVGREPAVPDAPPAVEL